LSLFNFLVYLRFCIAGTGYLLRDRSLLNKDTVQLTGQGEDCNKDTGNKVRLRRWSRGILAIVRAGGHIDTFAPLYKSESPTQVCINLDIEI